jgi:hypothetical protein
VDRGSWDSDLQAVRTERQASLVSFLTNELNLSFTLLQTAALSDESAHRTQAIDMATRALGVVRGLLGNIEDVHEWNTIHERADELEAALGTFAY